MSDLSDLCTKSLTEAAALIERREVWLDGDWRDCAVYDRAAMSPGFELTGPAIVEEAGGTSVIPPGWTVLVHASGALDCRLPVAF